jgi:dipeptidyl aminopeptidase/acylaminoacyl peptidase
VVATSWTTEWADIDQAERSRKPRRFDHAVYRRDDRGWVHDRRSHIWIVDASDRSTEPRRLTDTDPDEMSPAWHPDGNRIALLSAHGDPTRMQPGVDILEVEVASGEISYRHRSGRWFAVSYGADGTVWAVGGEDPTHVPAVTSLWSFSEDTPIDRTGHLDRSVWSFLLPPEMAEPAWVGDRFLIGYEDAGRVGVVSVGPDGDAEPVVSGDRYVTGFAAAPGGDRLVFTASGPTEPAELYESVGGDERRLTDLNAEFRTSVTLTEPDHWRTVSDGHEIDVWCYLPPGSDSVPVLVNIHGGPAAQYGFTFFDEFQVYAAAGFGVVACNPRGSSGRGLEFVRAVTGAGWGVVDVADVTAALNAALDRHDRLDPGRIGIMGGSYGGFLTAWMIGHSDRFRSAVVERALLGWESFSGTSDIAPNFSAAYLGAAPPEGHDRLREASPLSVAGRISAPTLIIHSENDFRCPIEQAEQLFMTLLRTGTTVSFLRFPNESHELSRSGLPSHRVERFEAIMDWHRRHLVDGA